MERDREQIPDVDVGWAGNGKEGRSCAFYAVVRSSDPAVDGERAGCALNSGVKSEVTAMSHSTAIFDLERSSSLLLARLRRGELHLHHP